MEWRCEWCGKPHPEDDPPCDNCGHGKFERAVVPAGPDGDGGPLVWVCTDCGREHPRNNPPCSRCGNMTLEKQRQDDVPVEPIDDGDDEQSFRDLWVDEDEPDGRETMTVWACTACGRAHPRNNPPCGRCGGMTFEQEERVYDEDGDWLEGKKSTSPEAGAAPSSETMTTWVCTDCGRSHPRNNPPCSRCGNMTLERREQSFDPVDTGGVGWLDAIDLKVALGFLGTLALLVLVVGPAMGVFDLPGTGPPAVEDVPGESEAVGGVALSDVEQSFVAQLGAARTETGAGDLSWNRELAALATFHNRWTVKQEYTQATGPSEEEVARAYSSVDSCENDAVTDGNHRTGETIDGQSPDAFDTADAMAAALVDSYLAARTGGPLPADSGAAGADVHVAPDGRLFVTVYVC